MEVLPIDTGAVMHRQVTCDGLKTPFIEWFVQHVVNVLEDPESLEQKDRVLFLDVRSRKSTVLRKPWQFLGSGRKNRESDRIFLVKWITNSLLLQFFQDSTFFAQAEHCQWMCLCKCRRKS